MPTIIYYLERFFQRQVLNISYLLTIIGECLLVSHSWGVRGQRPRSFKFVKDNFRPLQIIKGSRHVKKNRCEGLKKLIQSLDLNSTNAMLHVMQCGK